MGHSEIWSGLREFVVIVVAELSSLSLSLSIYIYIYIYIHVSLSLSLSIYHTHTHIYIYIYVYLSLSIYLSIYLSIFVSLYSYIRTGYPQPRTLSRSVPLLLILNEPRRLFRRAAGPGAVGAPATLGLIMMTVVTVGVLKMMLISEQ